jgi:hypothetical protein
MAAINILPQAVSKLPALDCHSTLPDIRIIQRRFPSSSSLLTLAVTSFKHISMKHFCYGSMFYIKSRTSVSDLVLYHAYTHRRSCAEVEETSLSWRKSFKWDFRSGDPDCSGGSSYQKYLFLTSTAWLNVNNKCSIFVLIHLPSTSYILFTDGVAKYCT